MTTPITEFFRARYEAGMSLPQILLERTKRNTESITFLGRDGVEDKLSYVDLLKQAWQLTCFLKQRGMREGTPVIFAIDDEKSLVISIWATFLGGGVAVPLTPPASYSVHDEALQKLIAVYRQCASMTRGAFETGPRVMLLSDLNPTALARHPEWQEHIDADTVFDIVKLFEECQQQTQTSFTLAHHHLPKAHALAMLMFSSGSTGDPKGVRLTHQQLLSNLIQLSERSELDVHDRSLSWLPLTHDMGLVLFHLCHTLAGIAQYKMTPLSFARDPASLLERTARYQITLLGMPNFGFDQVLRAALARPQETWQLSSVKLIYNGAEPIDPALCRRFVDHFAPYGLSRHVISPAWGIAEAAVAASGFYTSQLKQFDGIPSLWISGQQGLHIGHPIRLAQANEEGALELTSLGPPMTGMQIRVLDDDGEVMPASSLGHLEIKGPNVCAGYFGQAEHDWCPSGDIGFLHQGLVYLTGRAKDVIFLNGRNVYSNDIENSLCKTLDLAANTVAVVGINDPQRRVEQVFAFFRHDRATDRTSFAAKLRHCLEQQIAYPVTAAIGVAALPRTTSGKIRRFALRQALLNGDFAEQLLNDDEILHRPLAGREVEVAALISQVLAGNHHHGSVQLEAETPLSRFGFDSLGFIQLSHLFQQTYQLNLSPSELIRSSTIAGITSLFEQALANGANENQALPAHAAKHRIQFEGDRIPLTARQKMLWAAWLLEPEGTSYHETYWLNVKGEIHAQAWISAAQAVIASHPMLHAHVDDGDEPSLVLSDLRGVAASIEHHQCSSAEAMRLIEQANQQAFNLRQGPLLRMKLCSDQQQHTIWIAVHHIVTDGWSLHELLNQIFAVYRGDAMPVPQEKLWYDEAKFDTRILSEWKDQLTRAQAVLLPGHANNYLRGPTGMQTYRLSRSSSRAVEQWRLQHGSEFSLLASALLYLSARLAQISQPCMATIAHGRSRSAHTAKHGFFALSLPCTVDLAQHTTSSELIAEVEAYRLKIMSGEVPDLASLVMPGDTGLFDQVGDKIRLVYVHQNTPTIALPQTLQLEAQGRHRGTARTDICVSSYWSQDRLTLDWDYDANCFLREQIDSYAELFEHVLTQMLAEPEAPLANIDLLSSMQRAWYEAYHATHKNVDFSQSIVHRFETGAKLYPQLPALSDGKEHFSYAELRVQIDHVCAQIERAGVARGARVMLATSRSVDYVIALFACLKMACIAVPIDPALPAARIQQIANDSQSSFILSSLGITWDSELLASVPHQIIERAARFGPQHPGRQALATDLAYIIYTSGSTGKPKGVLNTHHSLINMVDWVMDDFQYQVGESICQFAPFSFDVSLAEILPSLCAGLYLHILPDERRASPALYLESMRENRINIATLTPAYLAVLNEQADQCKASLKALRLLILGGEALKTEEVRRFRQHSPHVQIMNVYGPTETTVLSSAYEVPQQLNDGRQWQPLGQPIANTEFWVLDEGHRVCPATVSGTLYIGGDGLSAGYWQDQEKTQHAFHLLSPDGGHARAFYCSGDLVRLAIDGQLEFIGRADSQIKLRGFRIELNEISSVLELHPLIQTAVVTAPVRQSHPSHNSDNTNQGERVLVAYYSGEVLSQAQLSQFASEHLPAHMRPANYVFIEQWPLNANRKIDIKALPAPNWHNNHRPISVRQASLSDTESKLIKIWTELLKVEAITADDNFALLGGSSLSAAQLVNRVRDQMGKELALIDILRHPNLSEMAACIDAAPSSKLLGPMRLHWDQTTHQIASEAQARMVFLEHSTPGTALNNIPLTLAFRKTTAALLNIDTLRKAATCLAQRHAILRTSLQIEAAGVMQVYEPHKPIDVRYYEAKDRQQAIEYLQQFHSQAFDLNQGPLWRLALVQSVEQQEWLALCLHHAIADGVTLVRLLEELAIAYQQGELGQLAEEYTYNDYIAWQNQINQGELGRQAEQFWTSKIHQSPKLRLPPPAIAKSVSNLGMQPSVAGHQFTVELNLKQTEKLQALTQQHQISPFSLMISLFGFVLGQSCESQRFALGITLSGRSHQAFENVPGLFVNTLPLAFEWTAKESLSDLLQRTKLNIASLQAIQDFPLNRAMAIMGQRELPFNVLFNEEMLPPHLSFAHRPAELEGISTGIAKFPLLISFLFGGECWRWRIEVREKECCRNWVDVLMQDMLKLIDDIDQDHAGRLEDLQIRDEELMALLSLK